MHEASHLDIANRSKQVVVMSHDAAFLRLIWDGIAAADTQSLHLARIGRDKTSITAWDIRQATTGSYRKDHDVLVQFRDCGEGEPRDVVRSIRPVLEGFLKTRFPGEFGEIKSFGGAFIKRIHEAQPGDALHAAWAIIDDLEDGECQDSCRTFVSFPAG